MAAQPVATQPHIGFGRNCCFILWCPSQKWKHKAPPVEPPKQHGLKQNPERAEMAALHDPFLWHQKSLR